MSPGVSVDEVKAAADPIYVRLMQEYVRLVKERGLHFASIVMMDACSAVLGAALMPFDEGARRQALSIVEEESLEVAGSKREEFELYLCGFEAGFKEAQT